LETGPSFRRRFVTICDDFASIECKIWGDHADNIYDVGTQVRFQTMEITIFRGVLKAQTTDESTYEVQLSFYYP